MPARGELKERRRLASVFSRAPAGVLLLGFLLLLLGCGFLLGGIFFALTAQIQNIGAWVMMIVVGPLAIHVGLHFLYLKHWAWLTVVALLALLLLSGVVRSVAASELPIMPILEVIVAAAALAYLSRPRVRRAFGWG